MTRVFVCVLDGVGAGEAPDAAAYGDRGSDTLRHVLEAQRRRAAQPRGARPWPGRRSAAGRPRPGATYGRLLERGAGKDTTTGHWEMMGLPSSSPFPTYPQGFPAEVIEPFERGHRARRAGQQARVGHGDHRRARRRARAQRASRSSTPRPTRSFRSPATRTSCRSSCSTSGVPIARAHPDRPHAVGRVIARPFAGGAGDFERTPRRRDFSLPPSGPTYLDLLSEAGVPVIGVGKIGEIFAQRGVEVDDHTTDNTAGLAACRRHLREMRHGLLFANLVDFDQIWGHRNDVAGFAAGLREVDDAVPGPPGRARARRRRRSGAPTTVSTRPRRAPTTPASTLRCWRPACPAGGTTASSRTSGRPPTSA